MPSWLADDHMAPGGLSPATMLVTPSLYGTGADALATTLRQCVPPALVTCSYYSWSTRPSGAAERFWLWLNCLCSFSTAFDLKQLLQRAATAASTQAGLLAFCYVYLSVQRQHAVRIVYCGGCVGLSGGSRPSQLGWP